MSNFKDFEIEDGVLKGYYGDENNVIIPTGITAIGDYAFECIDELFSVIIPDGVKSIGDNVFQCCHELSEIIIPNSVTSIGEEAFLDCDSLTSITIPHSVTKIGSYAFDGCVSLETVYFQSEEQKEKFKDCFGKAESIVERPHCTNADSFHTACVVQEQTNEKPSKAKFTATKSEVVQSVKQEATKAAKPKMTKTTASDLNVSNKNYIIENGKLIRYKGSAATPTIPEGVIVIGTGAFDGLPNMICTDLPITTEHIETGAFRNCPKLFRVAIMETVTSIDKGAFENNADRFYIDTTAGSYAAQYGKKNGIPVETDGLFTKNAMMMKKAKAARKAAESKK